TANVVLGNAFNVNVGVVVDTHVSRLSQRLGLTNQQTPEKIEEQLMALVPHKQWALFSHWLIWHGRRRCYARNPDCPNCELKTLCPTGQRVLNLTLNPNLNPAPRTKSQIPNPKFQKTPKAQAPKGKRKS